MNVTHTSGKRRNLYKRIGCAVGGGGGGVATVHEESSQTQSAFQPLTGTFAGLVA